jgi:hypothetical protein
MKKTALSLIALFAALQFSYAQWTTSGSNTIHSNSGNVGIGTTSPTYKLEVAGNFKTVSGSHTLFLTTGTGSNDALTLLYNGSDVAAIQLYANGTSYFNGGNVGIGTTDTRGYKFAVDGSAIATSMKVKPSGSWPDFVFLKDYKLPTLTEVKTYIDKNRHLPDMPSANEVHANGLDLGEMNRLLLKKVEELTLYLIEKDEKEKQHQGEIDQLKQALGSLNNKIDLLLKQQPESFQAKSVTQ